MQAIHTMYIIPLFDSFKQAYYTVMTVCVCFQLCTSTVLHMGPRPLMQINILLLHTGSDEMMARGVDASGPGEPGGGDRPCWTGEMEYEDCRVRTS